MAEVITRFKLETTQYDSKLRDVAISLADFTRKAALAGNEFGKFTQNSVEVARSFGNIGTSSTNAKDKVKELVGAFNAVAKQYNALTEEQQKSDFGKALSESMAKLKGRIADAKAEMNSTGGILGQLKDKFTINIDALKLFNAGLTAAKAVLDVAKDAFFNNEQQLDEWGRIVESSESLYTGFLNALNTGDISGYLRNIDSITQAARAAYDAMDALNTFNAFNQINVEKTRTGMTEAIADYRGGTGSKDAVKYAGEAYKNELKERKKLEREAYIEAVGKVAAERGVSKEDLLTALSGTYGSYQQLKNMPMSGTQTVFYGGGMFGGGGSYEKAVPNSIQEKLGDSLRRLNDTELQSLQALGAQAERTGNEIATVDKQLTRVLNGRGGGSGSGGGGGRGNTVTYVSGSIAEQEQLVQNLTKKWREAGDAVRNDYYKQLEAARQVLKDMQNPATQSLNITNIQGSSVSPVSGISRDFSILPEIDTSPLTQLESELERLIELQNTLGRTSPQAYQAIGTAIEGLSKEIDAFKGKDISNTADESAKSFQDAAGAIRSVGSAMQSIEDPTAKVMGMVAEAIASIALGFGQAIGKDAGSKGNVWYAIAAAAAGVASMVSTISAIHSATGYAEGGVIKGNSYSGDSQWARVNAGEVILNRAQASNVAGMLEGGFSQNLHLTATISGEQIRLALNNNGLRTGRGEYITTNFRS